MRMEEVDIDALTIDTDYQKPQAVDYVPQQGQHLQVETLKTLPSRFSTLEAQSFNTVSSATSRNTFSNMKSVRASESYATGLNAPQLRNRRIKRSTSSTNPSGLSKLIVAAKDGDLETVKALLRMPGTDILRRDPIQGQTALHVAVQNGHIEIAKCLLQPELVCSIIEIADRQRNTALHIASTTSYEMTKLLLEAGAIVNAVNTSNQTSLGMHITMSTSDDPAMTELLLSSNADPNMLVGNSRPLHVALDHKFYQIASRLVHYGARMDLKDENKRRAFEKVDEPLLIMLLQQAVYPPVWVPGEARKCCMQCSKRFAFMGSHRHHCRFCGRVVCSTCSSKQVPFKAMKFRHKKPRGLMISEELPAKSQTTGKQRVCKVCYIVVGERAHS